MYFPYLRGRQFELIAIRELLEKNLMSDRVIPIIEPVKCSSTLLKTMRLYSEKNTPLAIVHNPIVGSFVKELNEAKNIDMVKEFDKNCNNGNIINGHIVSEESEKHIQELLDKGIEKDKIMTINFSRNCLEPYKRTFLEFGCQYNLIPDDRKFGRVVTKNKVLFTNHFKKKKRNLDYYDIDEFYSDDHLFFSHEGYDGHSDFSIVGDEYSESGFAPYAVAIHIVYFNEDEELNIIHFVSESNSDIRDPGNKFYEAVEKLYEWGNSKDINTYGYNELIKHYDNQTYPGLGVVKKLCIMHHIELIGQYYGRVE